jgi:hypothetical protein
MASSPGSRYDPEVPRTHTGPAADLADITGGRRVSAPPPSSARIARAAESAGRAYGRARLRARTYLDDATAAAQRLTRRAGERARFLKKERPLHALGAFAVAGFVCGVALRLWRSQN